MASADGSEPTLLGQMFDLTSRMFARMAMMEQHMQRQDALLRLMVPAAWTQSSWGPPAEYHSWKSGSVYADPQLSLDMHQFKDHLKNIGL